MVNEEQEQSRLRGDELKAYLAKWREAETMVNDALTYAQFFAAKYTLAKKNWAVEDFSDGPSARTIQTMVNFGSAAQSVIAHAEEVTTLLEREVERAYGVVREGESE